MEAEFVADVRAGLHHDGIGSDDLEFEEGGSEAFEVVGVGEEGENFVDGAGEEDRAVDGEGFHFIWMSWDCRRVYVAEIRADVLGKACVGGVLKRYGMGGV